MARKSTRKATAREASSLVKTLDSMTSQELVALKQMVEQLMIGKQEAAVAAIRKAAEDAAKDIGLSLEDVFGKTKRSVKVAAKYVNPKDTTQTWSGRGRQPRWLAAAIKSGSKLEQFAVQ